MAEELNQLKLSNLEGINSVNTEEVPNSLKLSELETVTSTPLETKTIQETGLKLSDLEGVTLTESITQPDETISDYGGEPSTWEKIAYGIDKQNMFFGNVWRAGKAGIEAAFDPDKEFKEVMLEDTAIERAELNKSIGAIKRELELRKPNEKF